MKLFKKLAINVTSQLESFADQIENKEAISGAYIKEYERVVAQAKVKLIGVSEEANARKALSEKRQKEIELWSERARQIYPTDEQKALECVARMKKSQTLYNQALQDQKEIETLKEKMSADYDCALRKLEQLKTKHKSLAGRQACAEATRAVHEGGNSLEDDMGELFSRWETDVIAKELHSTSFTDTAPSDSLADEFEKQEHENELRNSLEQLIAKDSTQKGGAK